MHAPGFGVQSDQPITFCLADGGSLLLQFQLHVPIKSIERRNRATSLDPKAGYGQGYVIIVIILLSGVKISRLVSSALRQLWLFQLSLGLHWCCFLSLCWFLLLRTGVPLVLSFLVLNSNVGGYAFSQLHALVFIPLDLSGNKLTLASQ